MTTVAYHFWSPTCQPCKVLKPSIEQLKEEFSGVQWISVNLHEDPHDYALKYKVTVVPTIVVETLKDNKSILIEKQSGTNLINYYRILRNSIRQLSL